MAGARGKPRDQADPAGAQQPAPHPAHTLRDRVEFGLHVGQAPFEFLDILPRERLRLGLRLPGRDGNRHAVREFRVVEEAGLPRLETPRQCADARQFLSGLVRPDGEQPRSRGSQHPFAPGEPGRVCAGTRHGRCGHCRVPRAPPRPRDAIARAVSSARARSLPARSGSPSGSPAPAPPSRPRPPWRQRPATRPAGLRRPRGRRASGPAGRMPCAGTTGDRDPASVSRRARLRRRSRSSSPAPPVPRPARCCRRPRQGRGATRRGARPRAPAGRRPPRRRWRPRGGGVPRTGHRP